MNVNIQSRGFRTTASLAQHAERRLHSAIARHGARIQRVLVRLGDSNGPRGGVDKFCRIHVYLVDAPAAVIHDVGVDLYEVIDRAVERAARAVSRHIERARTFVRVGRAGADVAPRTAVIARSDRRLTTLAT
jgi:ribosome-associated translation inhibitor RaiA